MISVRGAEDLTNPSADVGATQSAPQSNDSFRLALEEAMQSALTKFNSFDAQFGEGRSVKDVSDILTKELRGDSEFAPLLEGPEKQEAMQTYVRTTVGKAYGE